LAYRDSDKEKRQTPPRLLLRQCSSRLSPLPRSLRAPLSLVWPSGEIEQQEEDGTGKINECWGPPGGDGVMGFVRRVCPVVGTRA